MTEKEAKALLAKIKKAEVTPQVAAIQNSAASLPTQFFNWLIPSQLTNRPSVASLERENAARLNRDTVNSLLKGVVMVGGAGAALRGLGGIRESISPRKKKRTGRIIEMPVPYPEKKAEPAKSWYSGATSSVGLPYTIPAALVGFPLAFYGGWKGVDALLDSQRRAQTSSELEDAKHNYEQALLSSYSKHANANADVVSSALSSAFKGLKSAADKAALFENLPGISTGLATAYALTSLPMGYYLVDKQMKKSTRKAMLEKALKERARRAAEAQPPEIYAIPSPVRSAPESV